LAKRGYRFLAPVSETSLTSNTAKSNATENEQSSVSQPKLSRPAPDQSSPSVFHLTRLEEMPLVSRTYVCALFLVIQAMYLIFYVVMLSRLPAAEEIIEHVFGAHPVVTIGAIISARSRRPPDTATKIQVWLNGPS
jgi:hypothetical protein